MALKTAPVAYNHRLFWDVEESAIDWQRHAPWVIERVFQFGTLNEIKNCVAYYGWPVVAEILQARRAIPPYIKDFWLQDLERDRMVKVHTDVLPKGALDLMADLARILTPDFVLCGGTAVALHLGHRKSEDLDIFTPNPFSAEDMLERLSAALEDVELTSKATNTLHTRIRGVQVSLIRQTGVTLQVGGKVRELPIADLETLTVLKLNAVAARGSRRDFIDLYAICLDQGMNVTSLLELAKRRLPGVNSGHLLRSLGYFEDAEQDAMPAMLAPFDWNQVRRFFTKGVQREIDRIRQ